MFVGGETLKVVGTLSPTSLFATSYLIPSEAIPEGATRSSSRARSLRSLTPGWCLATIFGLMVPIHIFQRRLGGNPFTRFGRAITLNFKANFWIGLVLAVAAIYEATEVILMNR